MMISYHKFIFFKNITFVCDSSIQWKGRSGAVVYGEFFVSDFTDIHILGPSSRC
jgi:hypothetical protein